MDVFGQHIPPVATDLVACTNCGKRMAAGRRALHAVGARTRSVMQRLMWRTILCRLMAPELLAPCGSEAMVRHTIMRAGLPHI